MSKEDTLQKWKWKKDMILLMNERIHHQQRGTTRNLKKFLQAEETYQMETVVY